MLLVIGLMLLLAIGVQAVAERVRVPTVSLLLLLGVAVGRPGLDLLPTQNGWFDTTAAISLTMIGFLLGGEFEWSALRKRGARTVSLSLGLTVGTAALVTLAARLAGADWTLALLLGGVAPATDPAATVSVLDELGEPDELDRTLRGIVGLDDVWGVLVFALAMAGADALDTGSLDAGLLVEAGLELGGSIAVGAVLGLVAAPVTARLRAGRPTLLEAVGLVLLCAGLCEALDLSPMLASVAMGAALANAARHHEHPFREVQDLEWPFLVVFFVLAGAGLEVDALAQVGGLAGVTIGTRTLGRFAGIGLGAIPLRDRTATTLLWTPLALLPQAGVALGLALSAGARFPDDAPTLLTVVVGSTLVFEVIGPPMTRFAVTRARRR